MKFHISKDQILKRVQSTFEKRDVICRQIFETVFTQLDAKKQSINKARTFIKNNRQGIQDYLFSIIRDKDVVNKVQSTLKRNPMVKNVIEYGDKYISHYIEVLNNKPQNNAKKTVYKAPSKKASSRKTKSASSLKSSIKEGITKSVTKKKPTKK